MSSVRIQIGTSGDSETSKDHAKQTRKSGISAGQKPVRPLGSALKNAGDRQGEMQDGQEDGQAAEQSGDTSLERTKVERRGEREPGRRKTEPKMEKSESPDGSIFGQPANDLVMIETGVEGPNQTSRTQSSNYGQNSYPRKC